MLDSPNYQNELDNELTLDQCLKVARDFIFYVKRNGFSGFVNLTGGDPLLKEGFWEIMNVLSEAGIKVGVLGNHHLINPMTADRLKRYGVWFYQLSVDGLEATHDYFRGAGSFQKTWEAVRLLRSQGIPVTISLTLSRRNMEEVDELIELCAANGVNYFRPARLVPEGRGKNFDRELLSPEQYREALFGMIGRVLTLPRRAGRPLGFPICDSLIIPLVAGEEGDQLPLFFKALHSVPMGCHSWFLAVLPDGTIYPCRRLPIKIGNVLKDTFEEAYSSELAEKLRTPQLHHGCSGCDYLNLCLGGCPAVTYGVTGDPLEKDPQCWIKTNDGPAQPASARNRQPDESNPLFQPLKFGSLTVPNRIFRSATLERVALPDGSPTEEHLTIYRRLIEGGCGLIIVGITYVAENGKMNGGENGLDKDYLVEPWEKVTDEVHRLGGKIAMQLTHQSVNDVPFQGDLMGPVARYYPDKFGGWIYCRAMAEEEIMEVIDQFVEAILRAEVAGFDSVQLQLAHGYLLSQFLFSTVNLRDDRWGGTLDNRSRVVTEIVGRARKKLKNKDFPIMAKIDCASGAAGGFDHKEASEVIARLAAAGIAAFELSGRDTLKTSRELNSGKNECYFQNQGEYIRAGNPGVILGICGGIRSRRKMEELMDKKFDFVALSRPFIREPDLVKKMISDPNYQPACVSCSLCFVKIKQNPLKCYLASK